MVNPLTVLGVPRELAATELANDSLGRLRAVIKGSYKNLSRHYHPDRGGDDDQMTAYTTAYSEIEAASDMVLTYWIEDMADAKSLRSANQTIQLREQLDERNMMVRHLLGVAVGVDQFAITGVTSPTSFLCDLDGDSFDQVVIEVRSPSDTVASLALRRIALTGPDHISERRYENGTWYDVLLSEKGRVIRKQPIPLTNPVSVTIIGRAEGAKSAHRAGHNPTTSALETRHQVRGITWHDPLHAWFMPRLNHMQKGGFVLVDAEGKRVAITGDVVT